MLTVGLMLFFFPPKSDAGWPAGPSSVYFGTEMKINACGIDNMIFSLTHWVYKL